MVKYESCLVTRQNGLERSGYRCDMHIRVLAGGISTEECFHKGDSAVLCVRNPMTDIANNHVLFVHSYVAVPMLVFDEQELLSVYQEFHQNPRGLEPLRQALEKARKNNLQKTDVFKMVKSYVTKMKNAKSDIPEIPKGGTTLNIWDLGGQKVFSDMHHHLIHNPHSMPKYNPISLPSILLQKVFHGMHEVYSSGRSMFVGVFDLEKLLTPGNKSQKKTLKFWLNSIGWNAGTADSRDAAPPVVLVGTHKDVVCSKSKSHLQKRSRDLYKQNHEIRRAHELLGDCIKEMEVYKQRKIKLYFPEQCS